jgi:fatty-acyl-CoA synthase
LLVDAERAARALAARFAPGERVAVWATGLPEWVILKFGAAMAGLTLVTVNPAYRSDELRYVLGQSRAAGIFMVREFRTPMAEYLAAARPKQPALREVVLFSEWDQFLASAAPEQPLPEVDPDDIAQIQYTSGTTGFPKGALLSRVPAFEPGLLLELLEAERANVMFAVPTMSIAMLEHPDFAHRDFSSWRCVCSGGAPVPFELALQIEKATDAAFLVAYGTTECSPIVTMAHLDDSLKDRANTLGLPVPQTEVKICDPLTDEAVPPGQVGELRARGYMVMAGYNDQPDATAAAIDGEGWYHSGDLASTDERGYLRIEGRIKDMIIRGGENVYPREIEDLLFAHPDVADVAVVGAPHERWGETVAAFIRTSAGSNANAEELRAYCREHLAAYKCPQHWEFLDQFPLTPSGKVQKFKLRERLISSTEANTGGAR